MQNFIKSLMFDVSLFWALPLFTWIKLTISKYRALSGILVGNKAERLSIGNNYIYVDSLSDLGTVVSSLSDEYYHLRKIVGEGLLVVVDVGANIGQFAAAIRYWFPKAKIISIEADPKTYKSLVKNASSAGHELINIAISDRAGVFDLYRGDISVASSLIKTSDKQTSVQVEADTLDSVLGRLGKIDLIKIDVEGAELNVLKGAQKSLGRCSYLLLEVSFLRETNSVTNLEVLAAVRDLCPQARIVHTGRKLGWNNDVLAQDFLIRLRDEL